MRTLLFLVVVVALFSCHSSTKENPSVTTVVTPVDSILAEPIEPPAIDSLDFPQGFWIGKSYYDSLQQGKLTSLFMENYLLTYFSNGQPMLTMGNNYGFTSGEVLLGKGNYIFEPDDPHTEFFHSFQLQKEEHSPLLVTNLYWGRDDLEELNPDTCYIKVYEDTEATRHQGFYQEEHTLEELYFKGTYHVLNNKNKQEYPNVQLHQQQIHHFIANTPLPFHYQSIFELPVVYIAQAAQYGQGYSLEAAQRTCYLPSERQYYVVEDTEEGFNLYELLQPQLSPTKGCIEADAIGTAAEKGELLFVFTKKAYFE